MKRSLLAAALCLLVALAPFAAVSGQTPRIIQRYSSTFNGVQPPGRHVDLAITASEFDPGARSVLHSNQVTRYFTVIAGELTITIGSETKLYSAGMNGIIPGGILTRFSNERGTAKAQLFIASLWLPQPTGPLPPVLVAPGETAPPIGPRVLATGRLPQIQVPTSGVNIMQVVQDWEPGAKNSPHTMNHPHLFIALEGENTTRYLDGDIQRTTSGQQGVMEPGRAGIMENTGIANNRLLVAWVLTPGTPNTSPATPPAEAPAISPPATGDAGLVNGSVRDDNSVARLFVGAASAGLLLLAAALRSASVTRR